MGASLGASTEAHERAYFRRRDAERRGPWAIRQGAALLGLARHSQTGDGEAPGVRRRALADARHPEMVRLMSGIPGHTFGPSPTQSGSAMTEIRCTPMPREL